MAVLLAAALTLMVVVLLLVAVAPGLRSPSASLSRLGLSGRRGRRGRSPVDHEAELRAEKLLGSVVGAENLEAYKALGFLHAFGAAEEDGMPGYGYLIYPHRPIVSFDARSGGLLNELCVSFPERESSEGGDRLPDADDVLAKWMAIRGDELALLAEANIWPPGRQVDPDQARRDLIRLQEWTSSASDSPSDGLTAAQ